ncbi:hypothetical protein D1007_43597 [Hordeum vulgare]|nr:hypothetical protein D1007_43597 [Hordeum vulgare]
MRLLSIVFLVPVSPVLGAGGRPTGGGGQGALGFGGCQFQRSEYGAPFHNNGRKFSSSHPGSSSMAVGDDILPPPPPLPHRFVPPSFDPPPTLTCFICNHHPHFQSKCEVPPFCLICPADGHLAVECKSRVKPPSFKQFGLGLPGCAFFSLDGDVTMASVAPGLSNESIITMLSHEISVEVLVD